MSHVMLDLETLGTDPGCVILSVGAVTFNPFGSGYQYEFTRNIEPELSKSLGFTVNPDTVAWWGKQNKEAWDAMQVDQMDIIQAMKEFVKWCVTVKIEQIWCQGANFDEPIIRAAIEKLGGKVPWKFWNVRDTRTVYDLCGFDPKRVARLGTYHNSVDDAKHQVTCVQEALVNGLRK